MWTYGHTYRIVFTGGQTLSGTLGLAQSADDEGGAGLWLYVPNWQDGRNTRRFVPATAMLWAEDAGRDPTWPSWQSERASADELARRMRGE
jgi:hypothetical protein